MCCRIREPVPVPPRKLNLDTPSQMKCGSLSSLGNARIPSHCETVLPLSTSRNDNCKNSVSPDNLLSQNSNFPSGSGSSQLPGASCPAALSLSSLLTHSKSCAAEFDEDFYMHELYSLEEADEDSTPSPVPKLGALLSCPVIDTSIISTSDSPNTKHTKPSLNVLSRHDTAPVIIMSPNTPKPASSNTRQSRGLRLLASNVDVSPFNPQTRPPIRRALSLYVPSASDNKINSNPNYAFKRPLPVNDVSPNVDPKRHKAVAVGGTPQFPSEKCSTSPSLISYEPLPVLNLSADEHSPDSSHLVAIPESNSLTQHSDASPELPSKPEDNRLTRSMTSYNLGPRQYSVPVVNAVAVPSLTSIAGKEREPLSRTVSESHLTIMKVLNQCQNTEEHTGDFKRVLCLPVVSAGRHPDINAISPETLADLLNGKYSDVVESYQILDCRYPYEFAGGHIVDAQNWHSQQFVVDLVEEATICAPMPCDPNKRNILIFHCEFSAERGPKAQRLLRDRDRKANWDQYPSLHYPETYLLEGGYKAFFEQFPEMCVPKKYTKMVDSEFAEDLKLCRSKSKTWASENKSGKSRTGPGSKKYSGRCLRE